MLHYIQLKFCYCQNISKTSTFSANVACYSHSHKYSNNKIISHCGHLSVACATHCGIHYYWPQQIVIVVVIVESTYVRHCCCCCWCCSCLYDCLNRNLLLLGQYLLDKCNKFFAIPDMLCDLHIILYYYICLYINICTYILYIVDNISKFYLYLSVINALL